MSAHQEHHLDWNDRLQDWLDGDLDHASVAAFESHLAQCTLCQGRVDEFERLDQAMHLAAPRIALDETFDQRVFAQIETMDESVRAAARQRIEQELQENLRALSRGWRRTLAFVVPGVIAGIAIAFALIAWLDDSGLAGTLAAETAGQLGRGASDMVLTAVLGAGVGLVVARWLATVAE